MRILRKRQVRDLTGLSDSTIARRERAGEFPRRVRLGDNAVGWVESEVHDYLRSLAARRDAGETT